MAKKIIWLLTSSMLVLSLILASCGTAAEEEEIDLTTETRIEKKTETKEEAKVEEKEVTVPGMPKYGGSLAYPLSGEPMTFDDFMGNYLLSGVHPVQTRLLIGDWTRGPSGTGELDFFLSDASFDTKMGQLAESWVVTPEAMTYKIRQGIHFAQNPGSEAHGLVGGRELTAEDIAYALNRLCKNKGSYIQKASPIMSDIVEITALDKYTLEVAIPAEWSYECHYFLAFFAYGDTAKEVVEKYGDYKDWRNLVGAGAYIMTDYVAGSALTFSRNPDYYWKDPCGPGEGNQLPYLDQIRMFIIIDSSTRAAALRTAKVDFMTVGATYDDAQILIQTSPELEYKHSGSSAAQTVNMRTDKPELPYDDIRVRHALMYATDYDSINEGLMGGLGRLPSWPIVYQTGLEGYYLSMEECSPEVQDLYNYNPDKAKELLAEAGYPDGFTAKIDVSSTLVDEVSVIKDQWQKVGVELELSVLESGVFRSLQIGRKHEEMIYGTTANTGLMWPRGYGAISGNTFANTSMINEQYIEDARVANQIAWSEGDMEEVYRLSKSVIAQVLYEAWAIPMPQKPLYYFWWPWLGGFNGAASAGAFTGPGYQYFWVDEDLKESMGY